MLLCRVVPIKMATCSLGSHSKSHLITPHCVLHYACSAVNTAPYVDSFSVDSTKHNHNAERLNWIRWFTCFLEILLQFVIIYYYPYAVVLLLLFIFLYCCILILEPLQVFLLVCKLYCYFNVHLCCLNVLHIYPLLLWHSCSDIPGLSNYTCILL